MNRSMSPRNLYLLIAIGCGSLYNSLITTDLSLLRYGQKLRGHNKISAGGFTTDFEKLSGICQVLAVPANTTATLINLIQYGDAWATETKKKTTGEFDRFRKGERVPGCMADVRITTTFNYDHLESITKHPRISVDGSADSRVAQGILALLCEGLENQECSNVLTLSPTDLSRECGLNSLLPVGRLNGLHNMVTVIHNQIKSELLRLREKENALLTADMDRERNADSLRALNPLNSDWSSVEGVDTSDEVAVLLSGGVDSSVALKLLQLQGHKVRAFYLKIWLEDEVAHLNECPWEEDLGYAERVCAQLGVPLETLSLQKEYWQEVVQYTFKEARAGRTPNPDVLCNSRIKFGMFYEYVGKHYSKIATGHYAQVLYGDESVEKSDAVLKAQIDRQAVAASVPSSVIEIGDDSSNEIWPVAEDEEQDNSRVVSSPRFLDGTRKSIDRNSGRARLVMSPDCIKDQTYFLSALSQEQLAKALFPIGHLQKYEVRMLAEQYQLPTRARKDSQGICFLGKLKFDEFIEHYLGENEGEIRCYQTGKILGHHRGLWFHTIGQRKGLGLHLQSVVHDGPWFVAAKEADSNTLYVTNDLSLVDRPRVEFRVHKMNWVGGLEPDGLWDPKGITMDIKLRHGPTLSRGNVRMTSDIPSTSVVIEGGLGESESAVNGILRVVLDKRDKGIAPGQFAAFYQGSECLGAGVIVDTAVDEIQRQEEHVSVAKSRLSPIKNRVIGVL